MKTPARRCIRHPASRSRPRHKHRPPCRPPPRNGGCSVAGHAWFRSLVGMVARRRSWRCPASVGVLQRSDHQDDQRRSGLVARAAGLHRAVRAMPDRRRNATERRHLHLPRQRQVPAARYRRRQQSWVRSASSTMGSPEHLLPGMDAVTTTLALALSCSSDGVPGRRRTTWVARGRAHRSSRPCGRASPPWPWA